MLSLRRGLQAQRDGTAQSRQDFLDCERRWLLLARGCEQEQAEHTKAFQQAFQRAAYFKAGCVI